MTVVMLIIPNLGPGGAQKVFRDQLRFFSTHFKTIGCVFNWDGCLPEDRELGIISLDVPAGKNVFSKALNFLKRIRKLRAIKKANNISHSISHLEGADYVNILSREIESLVCWIHGTKMFDREIRGPLGTLRKKILMPWLYRRDIELVTVSEGIRRELIGAIGIDEKRIKTIVNGFDLDAINKKKSEAPQFSLGAISDPIIITHCRLAPQKNIEALINIFALVRQSRSAKLIIVGDGELRDQLVSQAKSKGMSVYLGWNKDPVAGSYDVYFTGHLSNPYSLLSKASLYVMTSAWEGFPLALGEAMACGLPSMAADCFTGPREIIAPTLNIPQPVDVPQLTDLGLLMPLADSNDHIRVWSETVNRLLDDNALRQKYSAAGVRRISELDQKEISKKWLELLDNT